MKRYLLISMLLVTNAYAQSSSDLYQQALRKERTEGDLTSAIKLYQRVAGGSDRELAARALIRIGEAYERMGKQEALNAYQRVVREFADQRAAARTAQSHLAALQNKATLAKGTSNALAVSLVIADLDPEGRASPDGRFLTFVDWDHGGNVAIRDMQTGAQRHVTNSPDSYVADSAVYALTSIVSPDSKKIAYFWTPPNPRFWLPQLRLINVDGSNERVIIANADTAIEYIEPYDFSPDGSAILAGIYDKKGGVDLVLVSIADGKLKRLRQFDQDAPRRADISPDGRWIAFDHLADEQGTQRDIYIISANGEHEFKLTHPANDATPVWTPDGRYLLFWSARSGTPGLYAARFADGKLSGNPVLVAAQMPLNFLPMDFGADRLYFANAAGGGDIYTCAFDMKTARVQGEPEKLVGSFEGLNLISAWLSDGQRIVYMSKRGASSMNPNFGTLVLKDLRTGEETEYRQPVLQPAFSKPEPSPDGRYVLTKSQAFSGQELSIVDLQTKAVTVIARKEPGTTVNFGNWAIWSRDGKAIFYTGRLGPSGNRLYRYDLATRASTDLGEQGAGPMVLSPRGDSIAFIGGRGTNNLSLVMRSVNGGETRTIGRISSPASKATIRAGLAFTPDGQRLLYGVAVGVAGKPWQELVEIMSMPVAGGESVSTGLKMQEIRQISFGPNGKLMFTAGPADKMEIWSIENVLSRLPSGNR